MTMHPVQVWCLVTTLSLTWVNSSAQGPVMRVELSQEQKATLETSEATFMFLCQYDSSVGGIHTSSLLRNGHIELVSFDRLKDGSADCRSLGGEYADESERNREGKLEERQERAVTKAANIVTTGSESGRQQHTGPSGDWTRVVSEVVLQTVFNVGIIILTGAARAGWLGPCGQRLVMRLMREVHQPRPGQTLAACPPADPSGEDAEELQEICVEQGRAGRGRGGRLPV